MCDHELVSYFSGTVLCFCLAPETFAHDKPLVTRLNRTMQCFVLEQQHDVSNQTVPFQTVVLTVLLPAKFNYYKNSPITGEAWKVERDSFGGRKRN